MEVASLTTQVSIPDRDDWKNIRRALTYLKNTIDPPLTLETDTLTLIKLWVDVLCAVHPDM